MWMWMKDCISTLHFLVLFNGSLVEFFGNSRGASSKGSFVSTLISFGEGGVN